ncbi:hypothetical protein M422DRAFT_37908 [Sphaerobolus stellatus SS14]|uniref:Uncharacterized protein n=1 Tax=Sphaerobolus stellatus (strain SS14) TaxID=990650 RepID=A0A0C9UNW3_SPHS4|nr:hypothetical protein M422DRAFT_37908 [Sphaerobolus stellatus SS14]
MSSSKFTTNFAPYTPPPDEPPVSRLPALSTSKPSSFARGKMPWFSSQSSAQANISYQSGGIPTLGDHVSAIGSEEEAAVTPAQIWETRFGWRVDLCSAFVYLGGPITSLFFLILETKNDYIRFHAYQSALLTIPLILLRVLAAFIFPSWMQTFFTLVILVSQFGMAFRAYRDTTQNGLARYELPYIGPLAEKWVSEE